MPDDGNILSRAFSHDDFGRVEIRALRFIYINQRVDRGHADGGGHGVVGKRVARQFQRGFFVQIPRVFDELRIVVMLRVHVAVRAGQPAVF
ncbi:MAG TPA: hypothetical protein PLC54_03155 [Spirochaetales bacterium]|nr:hypothetical protein [Spirochaetales bacterium]